METRICTVCHRELPATLEYYYSCPVVKSGLTSRCKECSKQYDKDHAEQARQWREANKETLKIKKHLDYLKNKERYTEINKQWYLNNKTRHHKMSNQWKKNNPDKVRESSQRRYEKRKEHIAEVNRIWKQNHKEERNVAWQARRAKKLSMDNTLTIEQWETIKDYFNNKCCYCGMERKLTQDHFIPLSVNGEYTHNNIVPCCLSCNSSKNEKSFFEWYPTYKHYSKKREQKILKYLDYKDGKQQLSFAEAKLL